MTTGRINQVAILGHRGGSGAACSDLHANHSSGAVAPPSDGGGSRTMRVGGTRRRTEGRVDGVHRHGFVARECGIGRSPVGWAIVRHRAPASMRRNGPVTGDGKARAAAQSPDPPKNDPPMPDLSAPGASRPCGRTSTTWTTRGHTTKKSRMRSWSEAPGRRPAGHPADAVPPSTRGPTEPRRIQRRPRRLA